MSTAEIVAQGLMFAEGPVALSDGSVLFTQVAAGTLCRWRSPGAIETVARLGGGPNSAAIGPDSAIYVPNNGGMAIKAVDGVIVGAEAADDYSGGSIQRVDLVSGEFRTLYTACDGRRLSAPNDLVFDAHDVGGFWFTDSGMTFSTHREWGAIYYAHATGDHITRVVDKLPMPNGIGLSPDGGTLYVADSVSTRLLAWEVVGPGRLSSRYPKVIYVLKDGSVFDSLAVQENGNVCIGTIGAGGITTVDVNNGTAKHLAFPESTITNIAFGGADLRDAWVTGGSHLYRVRWPDAGLRTAHQL